MPLRYLLTFCCATTLLLTGLAAQLTLTENTNRYFRVLQANACDDYVIVTDPLGQTVQMGDGILIIQMGGADMATADNPNYGAITNYNNAGHYELSEVAARSGDTVFLTTELRYTYTTPGPGGTQ
ncbi:MAG: hypothetical protein WBA17_10245, partial [Saprospiraceae bacterium]